MAAPTGPNLFKVGCSGNKAQTIETCGRGTALAWKSARHLVLVIEWRRDISWRQADHLPPQQGRKLSACFSSRAPIQQRPLLQHSAPKRTFSFPPNPAVLLPTHLRRSAFWNGCPKAVIDPDAGSAAMRISGGQCRLQRAPKRACSFWPMNSFWYTAMSCTAFSILSEMHRLRI